MRSTLIILVLWAAGLGAAAQFGKISVLYAQLQALYAGQGVVALGLLVSVVGMVGLIFGTTAGLLVARIGPRRAIVAALAIGAAVSALQALEPAYGLMMVSRVVEGASHLAIVVVGPTLIAGLATDRYRGLAMTLWSSFFGVTYTVLALAAPALIGWGGAPAVFLVHAGWMVAIGVALALSLPPDPAAPARRQRHNLLRQHAEIYASPFLAAPAMGFLCYTFLYVALLTLLPPETPESHRALVAAGMPLASIVVSLTLGVWALSRVSAVRLVQLGYLAAIPGFVGLGLFWGQGAAMAASALWLAGALGIVQGASFAAIPALNVASDDRARAAGAIAQLGNLGTTTGTPVLAALLLYGGALGLALSAVILCLVGIGLHAWQAHRRGLASD